MPLIYPIRLLIIGLLWLTLSPAHAQLDTQHWMPPVWEPRDSGPQNFGGQAEPTQLVISTPFSETEATVALADGTPVITGTVVAGTPLIVELSTIRGMTYEAFTAETNKGLIITSELPVSVVYRNLSQLNQALASLKGSFALGEEFWAGTQTRVTNEKYGADDVHFISVMATEDGTEVTFAAPTDVNFTTAAGLEDTITVTLNRNQTYLVRNNNNTTTPTPAPDAAGFILYDGDNATNNLAGTHVTATQPIAVMAGGQHLRFPQAGIGDPIPADPTTPDADAGIDQIVPITSGIFPMLGTNYIVARGGTQRDEGAAPDPDDPTDYAIIIGTAPNTEVTIDGTLEATINEGEIYEYTLPGGREAIDQPHYIQTSAVAYVYHFSGLSNHELGMSIVPSLDCAGSQYLSFNRFGGANDNNRIHIFAPTAAFDDLFINEQRYTDFIGGVFDGELLDVPVIDWQTFSFDYPGDQRPNVIVQSSEYFHLAVIVGGPLPMPPTTVGDPGGTYAFLSNFARRVDVLDPIENYPIFRYVADTVLQGDSTTHCLRLASCSNIHQIDSIQTSPNTGNAYRQGAVGEPNDTCLVYVANPDYLGNDTITVFVSNELGIPGKVELIFNVGNGFPLAVADTFAIDAGEVATGNVLDNDRNPATGTPPTLVPDQNVSNGTLVFNPDGTFTYTPNDGFSGEDRFTYQICDDVVTDSCSSAVVLIQVSSPLEEGDLIVRDTTFTVDRNVALTADLNGSVTAPEGVGYTFTSTPITPPQNGTVTLTDNGTITYTSTGSFLGTDSIVYEVCTDTDPPVCAQATVTFIVVVPDGDDTDTDGDGIPDVDEVGPDPENPQDSDGDGIPDYLDPEEQEIVIYDGFAPGRGDDGWVIEGIRNPDYANNVVKIYNRWGNLVYEVTGYNNTDRAWTGEANVSTLGDSTVPDGTYFYTIDLGDGTPPRTGYVVLVR